VIGPRTVQHGADYNVLLTFKRDDKPTILTILLETADEINEQIHSISPSMAEGEVKTLTIPVSKSFSSKINSFFFMKKILKASNKGESTRLQSHSEIRRFRAICHHPHNREKIQHADPIQQTCLQAG
jgi:hypothetical protein